MSSPDTSKPDPADFLGGIGPPSPDDAKFRQAIYAHTIGAVRRRRRLKRACLLGALLGCYLGGIGTVRLIDFVPEGPAPSLAGKDDSSETEVSQVAPVKNETDAATAVQETTFERLRRLSDHYLFEERDWALALRYYGQALDAATDEERAISPEKDSWLLIALKNEQIKETRHENHGS